MAEEKQLSDEEQQKQKLFAELLKLKLIDLSTFPYRLQEQIVGTYKREDLKKYLQAPEQEPNQIALRKISRFLFNGASSHYKRLVLHFATMLTLDYYIEPYGLNTDKINKKTFKSAYQKSVDLVESMNIKHEFNRILHSVFKDGIFYGYIHQSKDSFFVQYLEPDYCKITFIQDGLFGFAFNFVYFQRYPERLSMFPPEFAEKYKQFEGSMGKRRSKLSPSYWVDLDFDNTICIKQDESTWFPIPPFVGVFEDVLNLSDFKALQKAEEEIANYKLLFQKIPIDEKTSEANKFLITEDFVRTFHDNIEESLPPQVGIITSAMDVQDISFERDTSDKNKVADATKQLWDAGGVSHLLFSSDGSGSVGLGLSVKTDEALAFSVLKQIERWINKYLKQFNGTYKFRIRMPEITWFNQKEWQSTLQQSATFGIPVKIQFGSSLGMQPSTASNMSFLENDILELPANYIPLASAHTGGLDAGGAPTKSEGDLSPSGAKQKDKQANANRAK